MFQIVTQIDLFLQTWGGLEAGCALEQCCSEVIAFVLM